MLERRPRSLAFGSSPASTRRGIAAAVAVLALASCDSGDDAAAAERPAQARVDAAPKPDNPQASDAEPGSDKDAAGIVLRLRDDADRATLIESLKAAPADYVAVFGPEFGPAVQAHVDALWASGKLRPGPWGPEQTETVIVSATKEELDGWRGSAGKFPKGYKRVARFIRPGVRVFQFKYVRPGETSGASFDGLIHVNGRWRLMPKPYRAAEEGTPFYEPTVAEQLCAHLSSLPSVPADFGASCVERMGVRARDYGPDGFSEFAKCAMTLTDVAALSTCRPGGADAGGAATAAPTSGDAATGPAGTGSP